MEIAAFSVLTLAAFGTGFIDAVVGGGGLIQIPALFTALPRELPATLFGTNKFASVFGTTNAAWRYARRVALAHHLARCAGRFCLLLRGRHGGRLVAARAVAPGDSRAVARQMFLFVISALILKFACDTFG